MANRPNSQSMNHCAIMHFVIYNNNTKQTFNRQSSKSRKTMCETPNRCSRDRTPPH